VAGAVLFNLPAHAENEECPALQAAYVAHPEARPVLLGALRNFGCSVPNTGSSTTSSTTAPTSSSTSSSSTTSTTAGPNTVGCASLQQTYLTNVGARVVLVPLLQSIGCAIPVVTTSSTSSSSSSSSSSSTSSTSSTSTTVVQGGNAAACVGLLGTYNSVPETRAQILPILVQLGCTVPGGNSTT
jgi:hypothetical protein